MPAKRESTRSRNSYSPPPSIEAVRKMVTTIAKNLSAYCSVCSWICVAACSTATTGPTTAATMMGGADSSITYHSACCVSWRAWLFIASVVGEQQAVRELDPAVDEHEQQQLERHRHRRRRQHHHAHRHQDVGDDEIDH